MTCDPGFGQRLPNGRWLILQELVCFDMGVSRFSELLRFEIAKNYSGLDVEVYGDPAGDFRAQTDETTPFQILRQNGLMGKPTHSNDVALRIESVETTLGRLIEGKSGFVLDHRCINLKKGPISKSCTVWPPKIVGRTSKNLKK